MRGMLLAAALMLPTIASAETPMSRTEAVAAEEALLTARIYEMRVYGDLQEMERFSEILEGCTFRLPDGSEDWIAIRDCLNATLPSAPSTPSR